MLMNYSSYRKWIFLWHTSSFELVMWERTSIFLKSSNCCWIVSCNSIFDKWLISKTESGSGLVEYKQNFEWAEANLDLIFEQASLSSIKQKIIIKLQYVSNKNHDQKLVHTWQMLGWWWEGDTQKLVTHYTFQHIFFCNLPALPSTLRWIDWLSWPIKNIVGFQAFQKALTSGILTRNTMISGLNNQ